MAGARGYRVPAADPGAIVAWPAGFGPRFIVCVDTEEEFDWRAPFSRANRAVSHVAALPAANARFAERGVPLIWLIDHPVADSPEAVAILRELVADGRSEIGAQLHPWVNPPFDEAVSRFNSFVGNLPESLEAAKIAALTDAIAAGFGRRPRLYRAGRYGIGPNTMAILAAQGYRADSSIRPAYDYSPEDGPDFSAADSRAFRTGPAGALIELPLTTVFTGRLRANGAGLYRRFGGIPRGRGVAARLGLLSRVALTPEDMPLADAAEAVRVAVGEGLPLLNFSFHSPSLVPGNTPYVRSEADLTAFHRWWYAILDLLDGLGARPASFGEVLDAADAACGVDAASASAAGGGACSSIG